MLNAVFLQINSVTIYKNIIFDILTRKYFFDKIIDMTIES